MTMKENKCSVYFNDNEYPCPISMAMDIIGARFAIHWGLV